MEAILHRSLRGGDGAVERAEQVVGASSPTDGTLDCSQELEASLQDGHRGSGQEWGMAPPGGREEGA